MRRLRIPRFSSPKDGGRLARTARSLVWCTLGLSLLQVGGCAHDPSARTSATRPTTETLDQVVSSVVERYRLPGIAVGVIWEGEVIYARGMGELVAGSGEKITPNSVFKIASISKGMTTGLLGRLVDAGKLSWDDPVVKHIPAFRMNDPWVTREMQVRDLLIHNSGLRAGAGDLMLWPEPNLFTREDIISGLEHLKPLHSFRTRYTYDNLLYVVAGEVAAAAGGASYEELIRRELFAPLGMTRCRVGEWRRDDVGEVAQPHMRKGEGNVVIRHDGAVIPAITSAAAGGIRCSLNDMLIWMRMWLDPELKTSLGESWLSAEQRNAIWTAQMPLPVSTRQRDWFDTRFSAYGFGWRLSDMDGTFTAGHTGTLAGMFSAMLLFPEQRHGFVFHINGDGGEARVVLSTMLTKLLIAPTEMLSVEQYAEAVAARDSEQSLEHVIPDTSDRQPAATADIAGKLGTYRDPWFGEVTVCRTSDDRVHFRAAKSPRMTGEVMRVGERLLVDWFDESVSAEAWIMFPEVESNPTTFQMAKVDPEEDFSYDYEDLFFTRVGDCPP